MGEMFHLALFGFDDERVGLELDEKQFVRMESRMVICGSCGRC